jgi:hypothetical protein
VSVACRVCGAAAVPDHAVRIRGREKDLFRCGSCDLLFFPDPDWLDEAYADPISEVDIGLPARCLNVARVTEALVRGERLGHLPALDYGGGYGLMTRFVRDRGIDMRTYDPYAKNLFAQGFEGAPADEQYGLISLVEVLEHLTDPVEVVAELAQHAQLVLVSTILVPPGLRNLRDWWYLLPDLGQHITFYSERSLREVGRRAGLELTTNHDGLHVLHRTPLSRMSRLVIRELRTSPTVGTLLRYRDRAVSLRARDGDEVAERMAARFR